MLRSVGAGERVTAPGHPVAGPSAAIASTHIYFNPGYQGVLADGIHGEGDAILNPINPDRFVVLMIAPSVEDDAGGAVPATEP